MSYNGNDNNFSGRIFVPAHLQNLAGLTSQEQLVLQRRFAEQAEEQQRRLQLQQFVAGNPNQLVQERNLQSALDMFHRRQFQIDLERDFHLRNQIMFEQQVQQRAEAALAQQQHELLLSSPTFARHRQQRQQIEASLVQQINSPGMSNNNNNQSQTTFGPVGNNEISNESSPPAASQSHPKSPRYEEDFIELLSGAASSSERGPPLYESIADILEKMKRNEAEQKISQVRTETFLPQAMGSYSAVEKQVEAPQEKVGLDSVAEETHTQKLVSSATLFPGDEKEGYVVDSPPSDQKAPDEINAGHAISFPENGNMRSPADEERPVHDTRNIDVLIATLQRSPLAPLPDAPVDPSPNVDQPSLPTIAEADSSSEVRPPPDARLFQLIQQLDHELGQTKSADALPENDMSDSPVEGDSEEEYSEDLSQEDAVSDEFMGSVEDDIETNISNQVISAAPLVLSKDDPWWPTKKHIMRERRLRASGGHHQSKVPAIPPLNKRLKLNPEQPGVLQKLPYCRIHIKYQQLKGISPQKAVFCSQVTEVHPTEPIVCCSVCVTWRHGACGGHHKWSSSQGTINPKSVFIPLCDLCFQEHNVLANDAELKKTLQKQRLQHLRKTLAANQIIRHVAFSKHQGSYKWPLGSVGSTHIAGHTRSVNARHEKAEKQWQEMVFKIVNPDQRPRDRIKVRLREFEKLQQHIEEAELCNDRHNMILFLQNDVAKETPVGCEVERSNFFDPLEDPIIEELDVKDEEKDCTIIEASESLSVGSPSQAESSDGETALNESSTTTRPATDPSTLESVTLTASQRNGSNASPSADGILSTEEYSMNDYSIDLDQKEEISGDQVIPNASRVKCSRPTCPRKPRHDSSFCSDACGISVLERDLLHSLEYSEDIHPSQFR